MVRVKRPVGKPVYGAGRLDEGVDVSTWRTRALTVFALAAGVALLGSSCSSSNNAGNASSSGPVSSDTVKSWAIPKGEKNGTYSAPKVPQSDKMVTVVTDKAWNAYNNGTSSTVSSYNADINILSLAAPYMLDGNDNIILNKDLMDSVTLTSSNPQTVVWKINPKAVWSDGAPVSCKDFYLHWLANNGGSPLFDSGGTTGYSQMNAPVCSDNGKTVTTTFSSPFADYKSLFDLSTNGMMPAHILEQYANVPDVTKLTPSSPASELKPAADFWNMAWQGFNPKYDLADGPYLITDFQQNQSITLKRNPKWWGNPGGPAGFVVKFNADVVSQAQQLQNNEVQVQGSLQPSVDGTNKLEGLSGQGITYASATGIQFEHLDLNFRNPLFQDIAVRKAFFECVNRDELVDKLVKPIYPNAKPQGSLLPTHVTTNQDYYSSEATGNAQQAKQTLEADGWTMGSDGVMVKNGQKLTFPISHTDIPRRDQTVQLVMNECKPAGFAITDGKDPQFLSGKLQAGQFAVALFAWSNIPVNSSGITAYQTKGGENFNDMSVPAADQDFTKALAQTTAEAGEPYYVDAEKQIAASYSTLPLFPTPDQWAFARGYQGIYLQPYNMVLWDANEWTVP
jgi:peptide/nickel transport system substrate-binding protein